MIEVIKQGKIDAIQVPVIYELNRQLAYDNPQFHIYEPNEGLMVFPNTPMSDVDMSKVNIPLVRNVSATGNLYYMANGMVMFDLQMEGSAEIAEAWTQAKIEVFKEEHDVDLIRDTKMIDVFDENGGTTGQKTVTVNDKLYFMDGEKKVKFSSPQYSYDGHAFWDYINFDMDYNKFQDYQTQEANDNYNAVGNKYAYGIKAIIPNINQDDIVEKITDRFIQLLSETRQNRTLTTQENEEIVRLIPVHEDTEWVINNKRNYPCPYYRPEEGGDNSQTVTSIVLESKPDSNRIPFTINHKNCKFRKQDDPAEDYQNHIEGSYVIWTAYGIKKEYVAHLFKSIAVDADGNKSWVQPHIPVDIDLFPIAGGEYVVPQEFLDNATYPITIT